MTKRYSLLCLGQSGSNRTFEKIISSLANHNADVEVVTWERTGKKGKNEFRNGIPFYYLMRGWGYKNWGLLIGKPIWMLILFIYLLRQRPDVIWAATFECALPAAFATRFTRVPFIYYIHDNISMSYKLPRIIISMLNGLDKWVMNHAKSIIVPDENRLPPFIDDLREKVHIFPNSPSIEIAPPLVEVPNRPFTIYANGSIEFGRGIKTLLTACGRFPECRVLIAGRVPEKRMHELIMSSTATIDYRGEIDHSTALNLYNEADIVFVFYDPTIEVNVLASPTKLYESMLMGKPVLMNEEVKLSSKINDWGIGYLCKYHDDIKLEKVLRQIHDDNADAKVKGEKARLLFENEYQWGLIEERLWKVVEAAAVV